MTTPAPSELTPQELDDLASVIADRMISDGPDGHCDGSELIAEDVAKWFAPRIASARAEGRALAQAERAVIATGRRLRDAERSKAVSILEGRTEANILALSDAEDRARRDWRMAVDALRELEKGATRG